jgi:CheY-like chemotaxis protein
MARAGWRTGKPLTRLRPLNPRRSWEGAARQEKEGSLHPSQKKILIVEDEMLAAMMIEDMVAELGHTVVAVASRLKDGLRMAGEKEIDFAILDVSLNGERSLAIAEALDAKGVPYVFATGYGARAVAGARRQAPTLPKPFRIEDLQRVLTTT